MNNICFGEVASWFFWTNGSVCLRINKAQPRFVCLSSFVSQVRSGLRWGHRGRGCARLWVVFRNSDSTNRSILTTTMDPACRLGAGDTSLPHQRCLSPPLTSGIVLSVLSVINFGAHRTVGNFSKKRQQTGWDRISVCPLLDGRNPHLNASD